jgi:hypothetical protein
MVHSAGIQDRDGAKLVLRALVTRFSGLELIWAAGGYAGKLVRWVATVLQRTLVIVKHPRRTQGFQVLQFRELPPASPCSQPSWYDRGAFYPVLRAGELPAA